MRLNLAGLTYEEYNNLTGLLQQGQFKAAALLAVKLVVAWDLDVLPSDPDLTAKIKFVELGKIVPEIMVQVKNELDAQSLDKFVVDLDKWTADDFDLFQQASFARNFVEIDRMLSAVVTVNGKPLDNPLSLVHGVLAMRAVGEAVGRVFAGKN